MPCAPYTRPGPLQDLPLEHFTSSPCNVSKTPQARPAKRQLTSPLPMNAAKRRMLMLEGAVSPKEVIALGSTSTPSPAPRVSRRKITFGSSLYPVAEGTESCDVDMLFVENCNSPNMSPRKHTKLAPALPIHPSTSQPSSSGSLWITSTAPQDRTVASHRSLAKTDPSSVHYPGFDIHMDTHPSFSHASNTRFLPPADFEEAELSKENVPPRRKGAKLSPSAHRGFSHHLPSPSLSLRPAFAGFHGSPPRFNPSNSGPFDHFAALAHLSPAFEDPVKAATPFGPTPLWTLEPPYHV